MQARACTGCGPLIAAWLKSFRLRLLLGVMVPVIVILSAGLLAELIDLRTHQMRQLNAEGQTFARITAGALEPALRQGEAAQVHHLVEALIANGVATRVVLNGPQGRVLHDRATPDHSIGGPIVTQPVGHDDPAGENQARLTLYLQDSVMLGRFLAEVRHHLLYSTAVIVLIAICVSAILAHMARPLNAMTDRIMRFRSGDLSGPIPGAGRHDELGTMAAALHDFRLNMQEVFDLRALNDRAARRERMRIRRAIESSRDAIVLTDENRHVVFCNPAAHNLLGGIVMGAPLAPAAWMDKNTADRALLDLHSAGGFSVETARRDARTGRDRRMRIWMGQICDEDGGFLGVVVNGSDHTDLFREASRAHYLSEHDSLTGLPNRRLLEDTLRRWVHEETDPVWILLADLDHFKLINDTLGHPVGDALLQHVAESFARCAGPGKLAARLGGDEFAVLAKGPNAQEVLNFVAESLVDDLSRPLPVQGRLLHSGISIGIAAVQPDDHSPTEGIRRADLALYEAKKKGRGRIETFHDTLESAIRRKTLLDRELRKAIKAGSIFPVFQMQTDLATGGICGFEALARWRHPEMGYISPAEFIPVAEEMGLIEDVTFVILSAACRAAVLWRDLGFEGRVAVNLSPKLFGGQVQEFVADALFAQNCPAEAIEIEITETVVLSTGDAARREIEALQALGLTIALDDFGMGYSSLSYLQRFSVDKIKIDREFVSQLPHATETRAIVVAITELGHALGMKVTGEGAETEDQRKILRDCNVDSLQGYVDGRPMDLGEATAMLRSLYKHRRDRA